MTRRSAFLVPFVLTAVTALVAGAVCKADRYQILGRVVDAAGRPIEDAAVRLLLDRVSMQQLVEEGSRARLVRTAATGAYLTRIDCERARGITDAPNPCAARPRHLTVAASAAGYRARLVVFRLKDLDIVEEGGGCLLQVPDVKLTRD
jgi:hypothetical protein